MEIAREQELKFDVGPDFRLPDLAGLPGVAAVDPAAEQELVAAYFDTPDLALARSRITLRRRTGGEDAGWHLKTPAEPGVRTEHRLPLGRARTKAPAALTGLVPAVLRGRVPVEAATLTTRRTVHRLRDADGRVLAEVADDAVTGADLGGDAGTATLLTWREVEVELVDGDPKLLRKAAKALVKAGAEPSASGSKLARVVGARLPAPYEPPAEPYAAMVWDDLRTHRDTLIALDPEARADEPDAVHQMRVAVRKLRSGLATFRPLLAEPAAEDLRGELQWLGTELGAARDAEVLRELLLAAVHAAPDELVLGPVAARIEQTYAHRHAAAHAELVEALKTDRYHRLLDALDAVLDAGPAEVPGKTVRKRAAKARRRVERRAVEADRPGAPDEAVHAVRKAAKRARYAATTLHDKQGKKEFKAVQEALGRRQDAVLARDELRLLGIQAYAAGENAFTYGLLHRAQQDAADAALADYRALR